MDRETPGFHDLILVLKSLCYSRTIYILHAENAEFEFVGECVEGTVLFFGKTLTLTGLRVGEPSIIDKLLNWLATFPSVSILVKSYVDEGALETIYPKKEIRSYSAKYDEPTNKVAYSKVPGDELAQALSIDMSTGQYTEPKLDVVYP
jgi:hypothetical protein